MVRTSSKDAGGRFRNQARPKRDLARSGFDGDTLVLPDFLEASLGAGHPWIYRDHVPVNLQLDNGTWVHVRAGKIEAWALWDPDSPIALRVFSHRQRPDERWFVDRVRDAVSMRRLCIDQSNTAYRVLFGEGDGLPGIVFDRYDRWGVMVTYTSSLDALVAPLARVVATELSLEGVLWRSSSAPRQVPLELLYGTRPPTDLVIIENGLRSYADLEAGQKTGLFLDQRDNRLTLARHAQGKCVLNLFCYTGGFSVAAAHAGATQVTSVDVSEPAIGRARDNFRLNGIDPSQHRFLAEDCYAYLARVVSEQQNFDLVICDPPSLARNRAQLATALRAYTLLNARAITCTSVGGLYAAASCTAQLSPEAFRNMLAEAARRARRKLQILHEAGHAPDHPQFTGHPEGRYLKFIIARVLDIP